MVRALDPVIVRGNHDAAAVTPGAELWFTPAAKTCILWTRELLSQENRDFLLALPPAEVEDDAHLCHGALFDPDYYTTTTREAAASMQVMALPLCFFGHTHYAEWFVSNGDEALPEQFPAPQGDEIRLQPGNAYMINPGSVGQPRDGNSQAGYAVWDTEAQTVVLHRVSYNVSATQRKMDDEGLPRSMSERLMMGV